MLKLFVCYILVCSCFCASIFRLNTAETIKLNPGDSLISTLGYFKVTLVSQNCVLSFSSLSVPNSTNNTAWANSVYYPVGNLSSPLLDPAKSCQYLTIVPGQVQTDDGSTFLSVGTDFNVSTILTVDDNGVLRLIGTYLLPNNLNQVSVEYNITTYQQNQNFVYAASQMQVTFGTSFPSVKNLRGWTYSVPGSGQASIYLTSNPQIGVDYFYNQFTLKNSQILDFNQNSFPGVIFPNITYNPRCVQPRLYLNFKPPFVFAADPYWPILTVYQQGRYKILEMTYSQLSPFYAPHRRRSLNFYNEYSVCPPYTFEFLGNCTASCPQPYFHEMRGSKGKCVLTCQEFTPTDTQNRICSCMPDYQKSKMSSTIVTSCPANSTNSPYGCYCNNPGQYYDRNFTFTCVSTCPNRTFGSNGLCMACPDNCDVCQIDGIFRSYLQCTTCSPNYILVGGQCALSCAPYLGLSLNSGGCVPCADRNCIDCQANSASCVKCNLLYSLSNGTCQLTCSNGTKQSTASNFASQCIPTDQNCSAFIPMHYKNTSYIKCDACPVGMYIFAGGCVSSCPTKFIPNQNGYCICSDINTVTVYNQCLPVKYCPITMGFDSVSQSCLSCPFGCLACKDNACTACNPGYFLYISPQAIRCRRKSPLFPCDQQYSWVQNVCLVTNYTNSDFQMQLCVNSINYCKICFTGRTDICILCSPGTYLLNNVCYNQCPSGMVVQDNVCILLEIKNCSIPYLLSQSEPAVVNYTVLAASGPYQYFTVNGLQPSNDPVGYNPYFQQISRRKNDGYFRETSFFQPSWTCLKCVDGQGMSDNFTFCLPCPPPCLTCYMAKNYSCLTYSNNSNNSNGNNSACKFYTDWQTKQCVDSCNVNTYPAVVSGILYCQPITNSIVNNYAKVDSAVYTAQNGSKIVYFVFADALKNSNISVPINQASLVSSSLYLSASSSDSANSPPLKAIVTSSNSTLGNDGSYAQLYDPTPNTSAYIMNLSNYLTKLQSNSGTYFPNSVYGVSVGLSHPQYMKTWLAFIGYVMSWVLILLHAVYIGNDLIYKVDNVIILAQTFYFFSFVKLLVGELLAQFYYGWVFAHGGFFMTFFQNSVPPGYYENAAPNSFKLATVDANIIRSAGFSFSLLLVYLGCYFVITSLVWIISKCLKKPDMWHPKIAVNSLIAGVQFFTMNIFFWAVAHLQYCNGGQSIDVDFYNTSNSVSIFFIVIICLYTVGRLIFNPMGGLYMLKRIIYATLLANAYNDNSYLAALVIFQVVFTILRYFGERPEKKSEKIFLLAQLILYLLCYFLLFLCMNTAANTIILSIVIFVIIVALGSDLGDLYLQSRNEWLSTDEVQKRSSLMIVKATAQDNDYK